MNRLPTKSKRTDTLFSLHDALPISAVPAMGAGLGADKLAMQQTISVYLISYALMSMVHGPLSDAMGRRRVLIGGLMMFVLASVGCALSARDRKSTRLNSSH